MEAKMKKYISGILIVAALVLVVAVIAAQGCSSQNTKQITEQLANDMTDEMKFSNGTVKSGNPPPEHAAEAGYPQSSITSAPSTLMLGQTFAVQVKQSGVTPSTDGGLGVKAASTDGVGTVTGAVVYINLATKYIQVNATVDSKGVMILTGQIEFDANLADVEATIRIAMQQSDGSVGNYSEWKVTMKQIDLDAEAFCSKLAECGQETDVTDCVASINASYRWFQSSFLSALSSCASSSDCSQFGICIGTAGENCTVYRGAQSAVENLCQMESKCGTTYSDCMSGWDVSGMTCISEVFWNNMSDCSKNYAGECSNIGSYMDYCMGFSQ
jgi:hypothetical protein